MSAPRRLRVIVLLLLFTVACDQATKHVAVASFTDAIPYSLAGGTVELFHAENSGAFLGLGSDFHDSTRFWLFTVGVSVLLLLFGLKLSKARSVIELVGWSLVVGGGLSNLIDRLLRDGRVVDVLRVGVGELRTGIFNIADAAIVAGVVCLFIAAFWRRRDEFHSPMHSRSW